MLAESDLSFYRALMRLTDEPGDLSALSVAKQALVDGIPSHTAALDETTAVLLWHQPTAGPPPRLAGDHNGWLVQEGCSHHQLQGLVWWVLRLMPASRIEYVFIDDNNGYLPDPRNPFRTYSGFGPMSELLMPGYRSHPAVEPFRTGKKGVTDTMHRIKIASKHLGYETHAFVDVPDTCNEAEQISVLVFNDGLDYVEFAQAPHMLRWLMNERQIPPVAAVYVCPPNRHLAGEPNRMTEYGLNPNYSRFLAEELIPRVENDFRIGGHRSRRATIGDSYGGLCALYTALSHPDVFGGAYSQSGYVGLHKDAIFPLVMERGTEIALCFDVGEYEHTVGASFLDPDELDFTQANLRLRDRLTETSIPFYFDIQPQGHTWGFWRDGLLKTLPVLYRLMSHHAEKF